MRHGLPNLPWSSSLPTPLRLEPSTSFHSSHCIKKERKITVLRSEMYLYNHKAAAPNLFGTRAWFHGRQFFHRPGTGPWLQDDSSALHWLWTLFLLLFHQLHFRSSGIRSQRLEAPAINYISTKTRNSKFQNIWEKIVLCAIKNIPKCLMLFKNWPLQGRQ